jgi:hypothetical protein
LAQGLIKVTPKPPKTSRRVAPIPSGVPLTPDNFIAWTLRAIKIRDANPLLNCFYVNRDPRWILQACDSLRRDGIEVPADWLQAESWAKLRPRGRGHPAKAQQIVKLFELRAIARTHFPEISEQDVRKWLHKETGLKRGYIRLLMLRYGRRQPAYPVWVQPPRPALPARFQPRRPARIL